MASASADSGPRGRFRLAQVARLLGVSPARIKAWVREGLLQAVESEGGAEEFNFCHVAGAKSLRELLRAGIPMSRLRRSARRLRAWLGDDPFAQLAVLARDGQLLVRLDDGQLAEPTGQLHLDFSEQSVAEAVSIHGHRSSEGWFAEGCRLERHREFAGAAEAYRAALAGGDPWPECCFNLANVLFELGEKEAAAARYRDAIALDPSCCLAWSNLGVTLADLGHAAESVAAFRRALELNPGYADAHYNLADALDGLGHEEEALASFNSYLRFERSGIWADYARERLTARGDVVV